MKLSKLTTSIEDLPLEMISELFKNLPPKDLASCSMVNKRWHSIYTSFKLQSLVATDSEDTFRWYHSNRPIQEAERCSRWMFVCLIEKLLLSNLKHLAVCIWRPEFDLNVLNRFQQLVHLEINFFPPDQKRTHLSLSSLKVLAFHEWNNRCPLSIDCPHLITLLYRGEPQDANLLKVKQPETIRKLETNMVGGKLVPFKSVECLVTRRFKGISTATLLSLPRLRELQYNGNIREMFEEESRRGPGIVDRLKRILGELLDEAKKLRGNDFRFSFSGFQLTSTMLKQIDFGVQTNESIRREYVNMEYVYMKNYHLIEPGALHFVHHVNYSDLLSYATGEFPLCFSQKFTNIYLVYATAKVQDVDHFLRFLKSLKSLNRLELLKTELGQAFYDQLPAVAPSLLGLYLAVGHCEDGLQVNFDFLGRLSRLSSLHIEPAISLESFPSLTKSLGRLEECNFLVQLRKEQIRIEKELDSTEWMTWRAGRLLFETENLEEILNFFDGLQEDTPEGSVASD